MLQKKTAWFALFLKVMNAMPASANLRFAAILQRAAAAVI
jgi:hypothetical protein